LDDLISDGIVGLMAAIDNFDARFNVKLKTYANHRIRGAILDGLREMDWAPRLQRVRARMISAAITRLERSINRTPTEDEIAAELGLSTSECREWLLGVWGVHLLSLEAHSPEMEGRDLLSVMCDRKELWPSRIAERSEMERLLAEAIQRAPLVERTVLSLYYNEELTLREIGQIIDLHESRISQLKARAILRLRSYLRSASPWNGDPKERPAA
jgi:RNA polymerase sigma factor for flagellar operon FliA